MPDYSKGKIYKLWSPELEDMIYIGSTIQPLSVRLGGHKCDYKRGKNCMSSKMFQLTDNIKIELIEEYPCENKDQLTKREGVLIRENPCVNKYIAGRDEKESKREWYESNKEKISAVGKQYYIEHKQKILEQSKLYYENKREEVKERVKQYNRQYSKKPEVKERKNQLRRERRAKKKLNQSSVSQSEEGTGAQEI